MFRLALTTLRFRKGGFAASFVALFFAAVILTACGGLMETGIRAHIPPQRFSDAPVVVTGDPTFDSEVLTERSRLDAASIDRIRSLPGVERAVTDVTFPAAVLKGDRPATGGAGLSGRGWSAALISGAPLADGAAPRGAGEAALDARLADRLGVRTGAELRLTAGGSTETFRVTGVVRTTTGTSDAVYVTDTEAGRLLGRPGQADSVAVFPAPGVSPGALADRIETALEDSSAVALTGDDRGAAEFPRTLEGAARLISMSAVFGGIAVMVAVFVVGSTLALLIQQRLREMALLRAMGSLPGQLRRMVVGETLVVGTLATVVALVPGHYAGRLLLEQIADGGLITPHLAYRAGWIPLITAVGTALLAATAAAFIASRRAARTRPADALAEAGLQQRWLSTPRLVFALLCFAGGTALAIITATVMNGTVAASTAGPSAMLWAGGIALISPGLTRVFNAVLHPPLRLISGLAGRLATDNARARRVRMAGAITPVMLATGLATALIYLQTSQDEASRSAAAELSSADAVLTSSAGGLPPELIDRVAAVPGVAGVSAYLPGTAFVVEPAEEGEEEEATELAVQGVTATGVDATLAVSAKQGSLTELRGESIALPTSLADRAGQRVGDTVTVVLGNGARIAAKVVASYEAKKGYDSAFLPAELMLKHSTSGLVPQLLVAADDGVPADRLVASLRDLAGTQPGLRVSGGGTEDVASEDTGTSAWINYLLAATILGYAAISLVNTLIVAASERRREFALQRLVGASPGQIMRMMTIESLLIAVVGILLGTVVAAATLTPFALALDDSWLPRGPVWIYAAVIGFVGALTLVATLLPTRYALRGRPADAVAVL